MTEIAVTNYSPLNATKAFFSIVSEHTWSVQTTRHNNACNGWKFNMATPLKIPTLDHRWLVFQQTTEGERFAWEKKIPQPIRLAVM